MVKNSSTPEKKVDSASKQANAAPPAQAKTQLASIRFKVFKAGLIFGVGGGEGVLTFKGKKYPINVSGVSLGLSIGISKADMVGEVRKLRKVGDIVGTYSASSSGAAIAGGGAVAILTNAKGVVIRIKGKQVGLSAGVNLAGINIGLK